MAAGDSYVWIGPVSGDWRVASNWEDVTTGANPAAVAPGINDAVTFNSSTSFVQLIGGVGNSASLSFNGDNAVLGQLSTGTLAVGTSATLGIEAGGTLTAASATSAGGISVSSAGAELLVSGTLAAAPFGPGTLAATGGGLIQIGALSSAGFSEQISVDATSSIEIGTAGGAAAGAITVDAGAIVSAGTSFFSGATSFSGNVIDNGTIAAGTGASVQLNSGTLSGSGVVEVGSGGNVSVGDTVTGGVTFQLGDKATLGLSANVGAGDAIDFAGTAGVLSISSTFGPFGPTFPTVSAPIAGFDQSDAILINGPSITAASFAGGTLSLLNGGSTVATLTLQGSYAGDTFLAFPVPPSGPMPGTETEIVLAPAPVGGGAPAGTPTPDSYVWIGPVSGDWRVASNWEDVTTGADPAAVAPGINDAVTFNSSTAFVQLIGGVGNSASLTFNGDNAVLGQLSTGTLAVNGSGSGTALSIDADATLAAASATSTGNISVNGAGAVLLVGGTLAVAPFELGTLAATGGGLIQVGALSSAGEQISVDASSSIEIGTAGGAAAGAITVDAGAIVSAGTSFFSGATSFSGNVIDNGTIAAGTGASVQLNSGTLSGSGVVEVGSGGNVSVGDTVTGGVTFQLGDKATLGLSANVGAGDAIDFAGTAGVLSISSTFGPFGPTFPTVSAPIAGFDQSDAILINGPSITAASFAGGTLSLLNGGSTVATLTLQGSYAGDTFLAFPVPPSGPMPGTETEIVLAPAPVGGGAPAGTPTPDSYVWIGPVSGDWRVASNWEDVTTGADPAAVAPGINDAVTFNSSTAFVQLIGGVGNSASLTFNGDNAVLGQLSTGTLAVNGSGSGTALSIDADATLAAASATLTGGINVNGAGAALLVGGTLAVAPFGLGTLAATGGGLIQVGALSSASFSEQISVDATSSIEIGTAGAAAAGAITVDAGAIAPAGTSFFSGATSFSGNVVDNGTIAANSASVYLNGGTLSGTGVVEVTSGGAVTVGDTVAGGITFQLGDKATLGLSANVGADDAIDFAGTAGVLSISSTLGPFGPTFPTVSAPIAGFDQSDAILINGPSITAASYAGGTLSLLNGGSVVTALTLQGSYAGDSFLAFPVAPSGPMPGTETEIAVLPGVITGGGGSVDVTFSPGQSLNLASILGNAALAPGGTLATLELDGPGTLAVGGGPVTIDDLTLAGGVVVTLAGGTIVADPVTVGAGSDIIGSGTITGGITDNGSIIASGGTLDLTDAITGTGTLVVGSGSTLELGQGVASSLTLDFAAGPGQVVQLGAPAAMAATIEGFGANDRIGFSGPATVTHSALGDALTVSSSGATLATLTFASGFDASLLSVTDTAGVITIACYAEGTLIRTDRGEVAVEVLRPGDSVRTWYGATRPIRWIGVRRLNLETCPYPEAARPVRVRAHAFGPGLPARDLLMSPEHAVYIADRRVLIPVRMLVNGGSIVVETAMRTVTYYHVELATHDLLIAEGLPAESYLDTGNRSMFENAGASAAPATWERDACAPLATDAETMEPIWRSLATRSAALGHAVTAPETTDEPGLHVRVADRELVPIFDAGRLVFALPEGADRITLASRATAPSTCRPWLNDRRRLGVAIGQMWADQTELDLHDRALGRGWWGVEQGDGRAWRWTDGAAELVLPQGTRRLALTVTGGTRYPLTQEAAGRMG